MGQVAAKLNILPPPEKWRQMKKGSRCKVYFWCFSFGVFSSPRGVLCRGYLQANNNLCPGSAHLRVLGWGGGKYKASPKQGDVFSFSLSVSPPAPLSLSLCLSSSLFLSLLSNRGPGMCWSWRGVVELEPCTTLPPCWWDWVPPTPTPGGLSLGSPAAALGSTAEFTKQTNDTHN